MRQFGVTDELRMCCVNGCGRPARHLWGDHVPFCCAHFTDLVIEIFDMRESVFTKIRQNTLDEIEWRVKHIVEQHNHPDAVREYRRRANRDSQIPGTECDPDPPPEGEPKASDGRSDKEK